MRRNEAVQAVEPRKAPVKRVAAWKAKETVKEHVIVQGKKRNVDEQQELPIKENGRLGKERKRLIVSRSYPRSSIWERRLSKTSRIYPPRKIWEV